MIFQSIDISKIGKDLKAINIESLILLLAACWMGQLLCSERWRLFATALKMPGSYRSFVQMYFTGMFFNIGLPSLIGGDFVKAYVLSRRSGQPMHLGLASVLQDRAVGLISLLIYGSLAIILCPMRWKGLPLWVFYAACWGGLAAGLGLLFKGERAYGRFLVADSKALSQRLLRKIAEFHQAMANSDMRSGTFLRIMFYSFMNSGLVLCIFQQATAASGHRVSIVQFSGLFPLVTLATMMPVTLGGLGVREWVYVEALAIVGVPRSAGLCISLATSALILACNAAGVVSLPFLPAELRRQVRELKKDETT